MKEKNKSLYIGAIAVCFLLFGLGFFVGKSQRETVLLHSETPALGIMPQTESLVENAEIPTVDLNRATVEELTALPGIGVAYAAAIVETREAHGAFSSVWELEAISGIGRGTIEKIAPYVTIMPS